MQTVSEAGVGSIGAVWLLIKAMASGVLCALLAWIAVLATHLWRMRSYNAKHGTTGLGAAAGGWTFLMTSPLVAVLLAAAFGIGFYAAVRWSLR